MSIAVILLLVTLGLDGVSSLSAAARTDDIEMAAMQAIAKSTGADRSLGWGVKSADPCDGTWPGVRCDKDSHVVAINASRAGLSGTLSGTDLVDLGYLTELDLSFNRLGDDMPILPRPLTYLTTLNLQSNSFMGMPETFFRSFPALETVVLDDNWSLSLARNDLKSGLPSSFAKNSKIKFLDISRQQDSIGLGMYNGFLDFVAGMTSLVEIHVAGDQFRGPLPDVSGLLNLKVFDAADNNLCGKLKFPPGVAVNVTGNPQIGKDCP
ncbi:hypothetical protein VPH35_020440 [Triticum aestivum]